MRILITGARSGIAYDTFKILIKKGHEVILCVHTESEEKSLKERVKFYGDRVCVYKLDITNNDDLKLLDNLSYDVLWAHAGIGNGGTLLAMDVDVLRGNYEVNVFGTMEVVKRGYNNFCKNNKKGKIFVTSSLAGMLVLPYLSCYTSSKAALSMLVKTINMELRDIGCDITISLIEPGAYKTGFNEVMIDNKDKFMVRDSYFYKNISCINKRQNILFSLIEKRSNCDLSLRIANEMEKDKPSFNIRVPLGQAVFSKIYSLFN